MRKIEGDIYKFNGKLDEAATNMKKQDIIDLIQKGHTIGCHTKTHMKLSQQKNINILKLVILIRLVFQKLVNLCQLLC